MLIVQLIFRFTVNKYRQTTFEVNSTNNNESMAQKLVIRVAIHEICTRRRVRAKLATIISLMVPAQTEGRHFILMNYACRYLFTFSFTFS